MVNQTMPNTYQYSQVPQLPQLGQVPVQAPFYPPMMS